MRLLRLSAIVVAALIASATPSQATFHLMQVEQVIGGVVGDPSAQAIQLRMRALGQNLVSAARLRAWDSRGRNPVLVIAFDTDVAAGGVGVRVLVTTSGMAAYTSPAVTPDFIATNAIPQSYLTGGSLTFEDDFGTVYWRLSWGNYRGDTTGALTNDDDGEFGPVYAGGLPASQVQGLLFQGTASALSTTNAADYSLTSGAASLTNNSGASFTVANPTDALPRFASVSLRNFPNPFNPGTSISFTPERPGEVHLQIFDLQGKWVRTLVHGFLPAEPVRVNWDGRDEGGRRVASGSYVARLQTSGHVATRKLILMK